MICPKCQRRPVVVAARDNGRIVEVRCDYPGCFAGEIHCCDGERAQPEAAVPQAEAVES